MKELIEYLEKKGFIEEANSLRNGGTTLDLNGSMFYSNDAGGRLLADALKTNSSITYLNLSSNQIGNEGAKEIATALKTNTTLTDLDFSSNDIGDIGAKEIAMALKTNTTLTDLDFSSNDIGDIGAKEIATALKTNITLTNVDLRGNDIEDIGAKEIAAVLKTNTALTKLYLGSNQIGDAGAKKIAEALKTNITLISLDLSNDSSLCLAKNPISELGAREIAKVLKTNTTLTKLYLGGNTIGNAGAKKIAPVLKTNTTLTSLDLSTNDIGDTGAKEIAEALKTNITLTSLDLSIDTNFGYIDDQIGKAGAKKIAEALKTNITLTSLNLENNPIGKTIGKEIEKRIDYNKGLITKLSLLLNHYFSEYNKNIDYAFKVLTASKFYQIVNKQILKENLQKQGIEDVETMLKDVDGLIKDNPFTVAGVCKNTQPNTKLAANDVHISHLPKELIAHIVAYLDYTSWGKWVINTTGNKRKHEVIEDDIDQLDQQKKAFHNIIVNKVEEIIYDKPLLNHPKLLGAALKKFSLKEIGERINELSPSLIDVAINSEDGELIILGGLMSLEYNEAPAG